MKRYVDVYDTELADAHAARQMEYYKRFYGGLPKEYQDQITMGTSTKKQDVARALDIAIRFHGLQQSKDTKSLEVAAAASIQDPTVSSRVTQCEHKILRLKKERQQPPDNPTQQNFTPSFQQNYYPSSQRNHSNQRFQRGGFKPSYRQQSPHHNQYGSRDSGTNSESAVSRQQGRLDRFNAWRRGNNRRGSFGGKSPQPRNGYGHPQDQKDEQPTSILKNQNSQRNQQPVQFASQGASLEGGYALQSEMESEGEDLDDTITQFAAYHEHVFLDFCAMKDEGLEPLSPGNY